DYIFRELAVSYLGRDDLAHFGPMDEADHDLAEEPQAPQLFPPAVVPGAAYAFEVGDSAGAPVVVTAAQGTAVATEPARLGSGLAASAVIELRTTGDRASKAAEARLKGYEGDPCDECGQMMMVRNGTCLKCLNCGATSGCS